MILIQSGVIDIEAQVDDQVFVVERLMKGSVLNYRNFLYKSEFKVSARCKSISQIMYLEDSTFEELRAKNEDIEQELKKFIAREANSEDNIEKIILDYIIPLSEVENDHKDQFASNSLPDENVRRNGNERVMSSYDKSDIPAKERRRITLTNLFKNAAIKLLLQNKQSRPPKLRDLLKLAIEKMKSKEAKKKEELSESDPESDGDTQTDFLKDAVDDIMISVAYTSGIINELNNY
jgi:CRP-like cAMP-binding protein